MRRIAPYLILLSLVGNVVFAVQFFSRDNHLNQVTWGNYVDEFWKHVAWASHDLMPRSDGRVVTPIENGVGQALADLNSLQSLPHFSRRADFHDLNTLQHFLRYAASAHSVALKEQGESGTVSPESAQRLARVKEGLELVARHQQRTNELKLSPNPWNHAGWRAVWHDIAQGLRAMEFVPLP